jgi:hypothetical protein
VATILQVDLLKSKGIDEEDATRVIDIVAKEEHKDFFVDFMVRQTRSILYREARSRFRRPVSAVLWGYSVGNSRLMALSRDGNLSLLAQHSCLLNSCVLKIAR